VNTSRLLAGLQIALDIAAAYRETRKPRKPRIAADVILLAFSGLLLCTFLSFALASVYLALRAAVSAPIAALLTGVVALAGSVVAFGFSRWLMQTKD
jgi:hypothetical protein